MITSDILFLEDTIEISASTPLLSNLNISENISLMKEVHHNFSTKDAINQAREMLKLIGLEELSNKRIHQCSSVEIFYVMLIRAMMCDRKNILILTPYDFVQQLDEFSLVIEKCHALKMTQNVMVIDVEKNINFYRNKKCTIIR